MNILTITDIAECVSNPCLNQGTCEDLVNGYICHCVAGYTGSSCIISESFYFANIAHTLDNALTFFLNSVYLRKLFICQNSFFNLGFFQGSSYLRCLKNSKISFFPSKMVHLI